MNDDKTKLFRIPLNKCICYIYKFYFQYMQLTNTFGELNKKLCFLISKIVFPSKITK